MFAVQRASAPLLILPIWPALVLTVCQGGPGGRWVSIAVAWLGITAELMLVDLPHG